MQQTQYKTFYDMALDIEFWRQLNPGLTITEKGCPVRGKPVRLSKAQEQDLQQSLIEEGYFHLDEILDPRELKRLAVAASVVQANMWPPVYCFVYDEFWLLGQKIASVVAAAIGSSYLQMPNFWTFFIPTSNESAGWFPHRDRGKLYNLRPDGSSESVNCWIPLTDATPLNGCMYMLPAHRDPHYHGDTHEQVIENFQDIRALPARVGSILGWNETVMHWGGRSSNRAPEPRIAWAAVYQSTRVGALEIPLLETDSILPFHIRLGLIGQQFHRFTVQNTFTPAEAELANRLGGLLPHNIHILDDENYYWDITNNHKRQDILPEPTRAKHYHPNLLPPPGPERDRRFILNDMVAERKA
ncbi:MAG: phytanoyl-CoA dioxygenase family protein [Cyanobacteria bacterium HKST-UBA02]|nr:phytanoyl-CoA dioxygenase family protein [Cyanobacteria bacterium HKST-UBA02]